MASTNETVQQAEKKNLNELLGGAGITNVPNPEQPLNKDTESGGMTSVPKVQEYRDDLDVGKSFPLIRINDHYFAPSEIQYFELDCFSFLPTISLRVRSYSKDLLKENIIKEGDKCAVFFMNSIDTIAPIRADFLITSFYSSKVNAENNKEGYSYYIKGELYIPMIHSSLIYSFSGSSRDALRDIARKLGLGFFFTDATDTADAQLWQCSPTDEMDLIDFIKDVTAHAWSGPNAFYDSWIDPRYALAFINVNTILGYEGFDQGIDITKFVNHFNTDYIDGKKIKDNSLDLVPKIFSNINTVPTAISPFNVRSYKVVNQTQSITKQIGMISKTTFNLNNPGLGNDSNSIDLEAALAYNRDKIAAGYYLLAGPGENLSYQQADNGSDYGTEHTKTKSEKIQDTFSDDDQAVILSTGSNASASGNVSKTFGMAEEHNKINNLQLQKQYILLTLDGVNLGIVKGEKVPVVLLDHGSLNEFLNVGALDKGGMINYLDPVACGWFMIDGIRWVFNQKNTDTIKFNKWQTIVKIVRREWCTPVEVINSGGNQTLMNNVADGSTLNSTSSDSSSLSSSDSSSASIVSSSITTEGLKPCMIEMVSAINEATSGKFSLVSARRYAVDQDGNIKEGNAFVKRKSDGKYKVKSSNGQIYWMSNNNSKHLYGEAIDIINSGQSYNDILNQIIFNDHCLYVMYKNGLSLASESNANTESIASKHWHIGTETESQNNWWNSVYQVRKSWSFGEGTQYAVPNYADYAKNNSSHSSEINNAIVEVDL